MVSRAVSKIVGKSKNLSLAVVLEIALFVFSVFSIIAAICTCAKEEKQVSILVPSDYDSWEITSTKKLDYPIPGHEDRYRIPRMNKIGFGFKEKSEAGKEYIDFPPGTVIAKEIYRNKPPEKDEKPLIITAMVKSPGNADAIGGWVWVVKQADGSETVMKNRFCFTCHENANEKHPYADGNPNGEFRDFVFFVPGLDGLKQNQENPSEY
jgi:hypothetical protein